MKKPLPFVAACLVAIIINAQAPQYIPYQAVARNAAGNLLANQNISLRFTIRETSGSGTIDYQETQSATTNSLGLFSVNIGNGAPITGTLSGIPWGNGITKFTQVEIDPTGGNSFTSLGASQMMSVPYALYAGNAVTGVTANNGITATTGLTPNITLGGTLTSNTTITQAAYTLVNNLTGIGDFEIEENGVPALYVLGNHGAGSDGNVGIGTTTVPRGGIGYAKLAIEGANGSANGPHVQFTTAADNYPVFQQLNWSHDNVALSYDAYYDGTSWRAASTSSPFQLYKISGALNFNYAAASTAGSAITFSTAMSIANSGLVKVNTLAGSGYRPVYTDASGNLVTISGSSSNKQVFSSSGTFTVPSGVNLLFVKLWGAGGGSAYSTGDGPGGGGGFVSGFLSVTPGAGLTVIVGQGGYGGTNTGNPSGSQSTGSSGNITGGGGLAGHGYSGTGGGRSAIQITSGTDAVTAGGGGGGSKNSKSWGGGGGGGLVGAAGAGGQIYNGGSGGTQTSGGIEIGNGTPNTCGNNSVFGSQYQGGRGCEGNDGSPGGGGGWYGGAGGGGGGDGPAGGGSSYISGLVQYMPIRNEQGTTSPNYVSGYQLTQNILLLPGGTDGSDYVSGIGVGGATVVSGTTGNNGGNGRVVIYW